MMRRLRTLASKKAATAIAVVAAVVAIPSVAMAVHFTDTAGNTHADNINWMETTGVTSGCTATKYCPDDPVTRAQMATFMRRLAGQAPGIDPVVNADKVDGVDAADLRTRSIPLTYANASVTAGTNGGYFVSAPGTATFRWSVQLPPDYVPGEPVIVNLPVFNSGAACNIHVTGDGTSIYRDGEPVPVAFPAPGSSADPVAGAVQAIPGARDVTNLQWELLPPDGFPTWQPLDGVEFKVNRIDDGSDTCGTIQFRNGSVTLG